MKIEIWIAIATFFLGFFAITMQASLTPHIVKYKPHWRTASVILFIISIGCFFKGIYSEPIVVTESPEEKIDSNESKNEFDSLKTLPLIPNHQQELETDKSELLNNESVNGEINNRNGLKDYSNYDIPLEEEFELIEQITTNEGVKLTIPPVANADIINLHFPKSTKEITIKYSNGHTQKKSF
jgi:hypothetical protein